jgi:thymidylate synthase
VKVFEGKTADEIWQLAANEFRSSGVSRSQTGRGGETKEILHAAFVLHEPRQRWVIQRQPPLNPAFAIAEIVWMLGGRNDSAFLKYWNSKVAKFAGSGETYHGAYGYRLRRHFGLDQLERAYLALQHNPNSRQIVLQIWDAQIDLPDEEGNAVSEDIPCNVTSMVKIRDGKLEWMQVMRSNDLVLGLPYNLIQWTTIQEVLAGWLGVELGAYNHLSDSLHLYTRNTKSIESVAPIVAARNEDSLSLPRSDAEPSFSELSCRIEALAAPVLSEGALLELAAVRDLPKAFQNMLLVVAAESARRRGWIRLADDVMSSCTNPALIQVWNQWQNRLQQCALGRRK